METTTFLAQLWGPVILAVAVGVFMSRKYYVKIYRDLEKDALAVLLFGVVAMTAGIVHIMYHNVWDTTPEIIISFLGWGLFVKGALFVVAPHFVDRAGDFWVKKHLISFVGILMFALSLYLIWFAYL